MKKSLFLAVAALTAAISITGCSGSATSTDSSSTEVTTSSVSSVSSSESSSSASDTSVTGTDNTVVDTTNFDPNAYSLPVNVSSISAYTIVSITGYSPDDFATMETILLAAAHGYNVSVDDASISAEFNALIGTENSSDDMWNEIRIITSAPNEYEAEYRVDLYIFNN